MRTRPGFRLLTSRVGRHIGFPNRGDLQGGVIVPPPSSDAFYEMGWAPDLPRETVDLTAPTVTGTVWDCPDSASFATALSGCAKGDRINLHAGVTYIPSTIDGFLLANKAGSGWVTITLRDADLANLPAINADGTTTDLSAGGSRVGRSHVDAGQLAIIQSYHGVNGTQYGICFRAGTALDGLYLRGVAMLMSPTYTGQNTYGLGVFGGFSTYPNGSVVDELADIPQHIILQQCYVENPITGGVKRAFEFHCDHSATANCMFIGRSTSYNEAQSYWMANCNGPQRHHNSAFIAPGINWFCGGTDLPSYMEGRQPSDITMEYCWFYKPPEWIRGHPSYLGTFQNCKNSHEFKSGKYIHLYRCVWNGSSHNNATMGQNGQTLTLKVLTESFFGNPKAHVTDREDATHGGQMWWTEVGHVTVEECRSRNAGSGFDILGVQDTIFSGIAVPTNNVLVQNCLVEITTDGSYTGTRRHFNLSGASAFSGTSSNWAIRHNTCMGAAIHIMTMSAVTPLDVHHNLRQFAFNNYNGGQGAWFGTINGATFPGGAIIDLYDPTTHHNAWIGDLTSRYPGYGVGDGGTNWMGGDDASFGLNSDGSLTSASLLKNAGTDGKDIGSTVDVLTATDGVETLSLLPSWP